MFKLNDKIYVGKLGKTVGLEGLIKVHIDTDFPEQFKKGTTFTTNKGLTLVVKSYNEDRGVIKFENIDSIDDAKKLINQELFSTIEETRRTCNLDENQFFWFDLIGCEIIDDESILLGVVKDIQRLPSSDYFEVVTSKELQDKELPRLFLIPYIDLYVQKVDVDSKTIYTKDCFAILENS